MSTWLRWPDLALPVGLAAVGTAELVVTQPHGWGWALLLELVAAALLVPRRRHALWVTPSAAVTLLQMPWIGPQLDETAAPILYCAVCGYTLGRWVADLRGLAAIGVILASFVVDYRFVDARVHGIGDVIFVLTLILPPYVFGRITRRLAEQSEQLERQAAQLRDQAVRDERDRIARELHDVIAHSVSAMVVQTAAAQDLLGTDPGRAAEVLGAVAETGRRALSETGRLLHVIRDESDELGLRPAPGLADVPALVETFRAAGMDLEAEVVAPDRRLPGGVDVSAYRVVQEVLTNALRYADGPVRLAVRPSADLVSIRSSNAVRSQQRSSGAGLGLRGMAERVQLLGGTMRHHLEAGRFELTVTLPTEVSA